MRGFQPRVARTRGGDFRLQLPAVERDMLRTLPSQLRELLGSGDPALVRLHPPAHPDDPDLNAEYEALVREDLTARRLQALRVMEETIDAELLDRDQLTAWLAALNDLRLVLGTRLDVTEDMDPVRPDHPDAQAHGLYGYLTLLEEQVVEALAADLPARGIEESP
jgi:Domain of unknown function (DUF2017)